MAEPTVRYLHLKHTQLRAGCRQAESLSHCAFRLLHSGLETLDACIFRSADSRCRALSRSELGVARVAAGGVPRWGCVWRADPHPRNVADHLHADHLLAGDAI